MLFKTKKVKRLEAQVDEANTSLQKFASALFDTQEVLNTGLCECLSVRRSRDLRGGVKLSFSFKEDEWKAVMSDGYALHLAAEHILAGLMTELEDKDFRPRAVGKYVLKFSMRNVPVKGQLYLTKDYGSTPFVGKAAMFDTSHEADAFGHGADGSIDWELCFIGSQN